MACVAADNGLVARSWVFDAEPSVSVEGDIVSQADHKASINCVTDDTLCLSCGR